MTTAGWATLDVIPSVKNLRSQLEKQTSRDFATAGRKGGEQFGDAVAKGATSRFGQVKGKFASIAKDAVAPVAGILGGVAAFDFLKGSLDEAREAATVGRQTAAVIKATGGAAQISAGQISDLAGELSKKIGVDDEAIQSGENLLLTFRNIKNEAGSGNDIFNQATQAITDLSAAMGQDLKSSAVQVGKALNDPIKGMTALQRVGVTFTDQQKEQAKALVANGDLLGAQKIILRELNKEFDGAAEAGHDAIDKLGVSFKNLEESLGTVALPAINGFATVTDKVLIPGMESAGGAVGDAASAFNSLPTPIKAATAALVAFRLAQASGLTASFASNAQSFVRSFDDLRLRASFAADEFRNLRTETTHWASDSARSFTPAVGRMTASLGALKAVSAGAGSALKRGLGGAVSLVGGPWGIAIAAGTIAITHFWQQHQEAKQFVDDLTDSLDKQTGALSANSRELIFNGLQKSGAIAAAKELNINLADLQGAAEGNVAALGRVKSVIDDIAGGRGFAGGRGDPLGLSSLAGSDQQDAANKIRDALGDAGVALALAQGNQRDFAAATGLASDATGQATSGLRTYSQTAANASSAIKRLREQEQGRRDDLIQDRRDSIALKETLASAREEARKGKKTLNENTKAGRDNMSALLDLADQWNNSSPKVQNARGAYKDLRGEFINLADQMNGPNGTREQARKLADQLLKVPKTAPLKFQSEGFKELMAQIRQVKATTDLSLTVHANRLAEQTGERPTTSTPGTNPRTTSTPDASPRGVTFTGPITVNADTYADTVNGIQRHTRAAQLDGVNRGG